MELYDVVEAEFRPARTDDLKPGAEAFIGKRLRWCASWLITEEDNEEYAGEFAMMPVGDGPFPFAWAPQRDLGPVARS
ncbi:hypothetical protein [Nocardia wallacei]|uniref:hypothetical protein n=1 Tax=Nocardia wallacei TaxID=480035 RepID=UPI002458B7FA|nr:hypothetical protein [Nocardia wallacei]